MNDVNLLPADTYIIINKTILTNEDRLLLTMLYQPIIGSIAISLYFTMWSYLDKRELISTEWTHHHLMASMRIDLESIKQSREQLEAIGLLKTYVKQNSVNNYIYELFSPLTPFDFLSNPILNTALYNNVGQVEYEKIINYYEVPTPNLSEYTDITSTFNDVFTPVTELPVEMLSADIKRNTTRRLQLISKLDINNMLSKIPEEMLNHRGITNEIKELIYKLSFIYSLDEENSVELIKNSLNEKRLIDKELLITNCERYFKFENNGKLPSLAYKKQPEYLRKQVTGTTNRDKMIYIFETTSPSNFLSSRNNTGNITNTDREILSYLLIELKFNPGVVNVLIDYILKINNNKLIRNFVEVIAIQWKRSNIETVDEAMELAEKEYKSRLNNKTNQRGQKRRVEAIPDWFDQEIEVKVPTDNRRKEIEEMLKEYK